MKEYETVRIEICSFDTKDIICYSVQDQQSGNDGIGDDDDIFTGTF